MLALVMEIFRRFFCLCELFVRQLPPVLFIGNESSGPALDESEETSCSGVGLVQALPRIPATDLSRFCYISSFGNRRSLGQDRGEWRGRGSLRRASFPLIFVFLLVAINVFKDGLESDSEARVRREFRLIQGSGLISHPLVDEGYATAGFASQFQWVFFTAFVAGGALWKSRFLRKWLSWRESIRREERALLARGLHDSLGVHFVEIQALVSLIENWEGCPHGRSERSDVCEIGVRLSVATKELSEAIRELTWIADPVDQSLEALFLRLADYGQRFAVKNGMTCRLSIPDEFRAIAVELETRHHVFLALKEALTNVVKHANATQICLGFKVQHPLAVIDISDDGRGSFCRSKGGGGLGNIEWRARELGGTANFSYQGGKGHRVCLVFRY